MKAEEAKKIAMANQTPIEEIFKSIKLSAENGGSSIGIFSMSEGNMMELVKLGYSVKSHPNPISGDKSVIINWE